MRLKRIYKRGAILDRSTYAQLQELDKKIFVGCDNEFKTNRDWWVITDKRGAIISYCGCIYKDGVCIFNRAWVEKKYRGKGIQRKMIAARIRAAKPICKSVVTYTTHTNVHSANNLFRCGFLLFHPVYAYVGKDVLYFIKKL